LKATAWASVAHVLFFYPIFLGPMSIGIDLNWFERKTHAIAASARSPPGAGFSKAGGKAQAPGMPAGGKGMMGPGMGMGMGPRSPPESRVGTGSLGSFHRFDKFSFPLNSRDLATL